MMDTYANLQASISNWMGRSDIDPQIPDFIQIVESQLNNNPDFRIQEMICKAQSTISDNEIGLPVDYLGMRLLRYRDGAEIPQIAPARLHECYPSSLAFSNIGQRLELNNTVSDLDIDLFYYQQIPALSDTNTSNWLLALSPSIYLYGALVAASSFLKDDPRVPLWAQQYQAEVAGMINADKTDRWSGTVRMA